MVRTTEIRMIMPGSTYLGELFVEKHFFLHGGVVVQVRLTVAPRMAKPRELVLIR